VIPLGEIVGRIRALGVPDAVAVAAGSLAGGLGDAAAWVKRLREQTAAVLRAPAPAGRRSA
jgi:hypothetical protein